jgi:hypothetical protein
MSLSRLLAFQMFQALIMKFGDPRQGTNIFGICCDSFPDYFHFSIMAFHLSIMALEGLIVVLLTSGEIPVALGHLLLELSLAQGQLFQYAFNAVQTIIAIRHVRTLPPAYHPATFIRPGIGGGDESFVSV